MEEKKTPIRLLRVTTAALFAELIPLVVLVAVVTVFGFLVAPGQDKAVYEAFADKAGNYIGPVVGVLATLGMGFWAARKPASTRLLHGTLTGAFVVLLDLAIFATPKADFDLVDVLVLLAKFLAGVLGGFWAERRYQSLAGEDPKSQRII